MLSNTHSRVNVGILLFLVAVLGIYSVYITGLLLKINSNKQDKAVTQFSEISDYPECLLGICPSYFSMDVDGDEKAETVIVQPTAMTQGAGKVLVIKNGKKILETEDKAQIWVTSSGVNNGFILQYSSKRDENMRSIKYEQVYKYENNTFIALEPTQVGLQ